MRPGNVLLAGFEPFGGREENVSALTARMLDGREIAGRRVVSTVLPVRFEDAIDVLSVRLQSVDPELVICMGEASGRNELSVERIAINVDDARMPDNAGAEPIDRPIHMARSPTGRRYQSRPLSRRSTDSAFPRLSLRPRGLLYVTTSFTAS
jgi:pyroglutamyl-peptidase